MTMKNRHTVRLHPPSVEAAPLIFEIARQNDIVDTYPEYLYLTMCRDFATTSLIASSADQVVAYALAYTTPDRSDTLFIWQLASVSSPRPSGVARRLIRALIKDRGPQLRYVEATIDPGNRAIHNVLAKIAKELDAQIYLRKLFEPHYFKSDHPPEHLVSIGPLPEVA